MKTVYINESMAKLLKESVLMDAFPSDIMQAIENGKTTFGNNPDFRMGNAFFKKAAMSRFETSRDALKKMGQIDSVDAKTTEEALAKIIVKCQKIERENKDALEKIATNYVIDLFSVPDDTVKIEAKLVDQIENGDGVSPIEPFDGDVNFELTDLDELDSIGKEVYKRQILNAINMGAGMRISENIRGFIDDLYDVDSRLPQLYKEALALNNYMLFKREDLGISDKSRRQIGLVKVRYTNQDELVYISAQGVIFPILVCELIRGFMELFSSHGLPKDRQRADYIVKKTDFLKAEPWLMRIGPYMWDVFSEYFEETETSDMPYIYQTISKLTPKSFFKVISEMFAKTAKGKAYAKKILDKALNEKERASFDSRMTARQTKKNIITDGCMSPDEF